MYGTNGRVQLTVGALTHAGQMRRINQDWLGHYVPPDPTTRATKGSLFIVADGMGGRQEGHVASRLAVQTLLQAYYGDPSRSVAHSLSRAIRQANAQLHTYGAYYPAYRGMATTLVAAVVRGQELVVAHVGDSRAYLVRGADTWPLTRDHSWVVQMMASGVLTPAEAARHPYRHVILRSLGPHPDVQVDMHRLSLAAGDALILCSDGLSDLVSEGEMGWAARSWKPQQAVQALVAWANQRGGTDNVSAIVVQAQQPAGQPVSHPAYARRPVQPGQAARRGAIPGPRHRPRPLLPLTASLGAAAAFITLAMYFVASL